jgi:hypothetical protein
VVQNTRASGADAAQTSAKNHTTIFYGYICTHLGWGGVLVRIFLGCGYGADGTSTIYVYFSASTANDDFDPARKGKRTRLLDKS